MTEELPAVGPSSNGSDASPTGKRKKRVRAWTASDRAKHRVFEKGRREAFNERLMDLARLLPSLSNAKESQLSKHVIVDESVKQHQMQANLIESLKQDLDKVLAEHQQLLAEFNGLRQCLCLPVSNVHPMDMNGASLNLPDGEGSMETNDMPLTHATMHHLGQDIFHPVDRDPEMLMVHETTDSRQVHFECDEPQVPSSQAQSISSIQGIVEAGAVFEPSNSCGAPTALDTSMLQSNNLQQDLEIVVPTTMEYFDPSTLQVYGNDHWNQHETLNARKMFNIGYSGGQHPSIISNG